MAGLKTIGAVHTHTHTHTIHLAKCMVSLAIVKNKKQENGMLVWDISIIFAYNGKEIIWFWNKIIVKRLAEQYFKYY